MSRILVTGVAGFIGFHLCRRLLQRGDEVVGVDNLNSYYDPQLKKDRLEQLKEFASFRFRRVDIVDRDALSGLFRETDPQRVVHLAAQAGVRYSIEHPAAYIDSNLVGFANMLEACRAHTVQHLVYASSSSVYGANAKTPFSTRDNVDHPLSLYAATKKSNELMAHAYSHLYRIPTTGLRFFTVYGPWGRPDMAIYQFTERMLAREPIDVYNRGAMRRDFTYIDDAADCVVKLLDRIPEPDPEWRAEQPRADTSDAPYRVFNLGGNQPVELTRVIELLEESLQVKAERRLLPMQLGDVPETVSDTSALTEWIGMQPATPIEEGLPRFVEWYLGYRCRTP